MPSIIVNNGLAFRQPSDTYGRQSWRRPRVPKSLWGWSSGDCGLPAVTVNQVFGPFLLLFRGHLGGRFKLFTSCPAYSARVASNYFIKIVIDE